LEEYITFIFKVLLLVTISFLLGVFFDPEDGGGMFYQMQNHSVTTQKTQFFIGTTLRTSNRTQ
jgi:UPF0716 family protein affecting phage T7 exclusion